MDSQSHRCPALSDEKWEFYLWEEHAIYWDSSTTVNSRKKWLECSPWMPRHTVTIYYTRVLQLDFFYLFSFNSLIWRHQVVVQMRGELNEGEGTQCVALVGACCFRFEWDLKHDHGCPVAVTDQWVWRLIRHTEEQFMQLWIKVSCFGNVLFWRHSQN